VFGAGGGTSSYQEVEESDVIVLWGSNARNAHPIFFHRVLTAVRRGAKLFVVDPRRSETAQWADLWLGLDVGTDIALANTMARHIITRGLHHRPFIERATTGFEAFATSVQDWTLERGESVTGVPAWAIAELAEAYATADRAQLCWTLGITEHHNATDNVLALINLALLCGHVGRYGSGLNPLRGQNNVQGGGDMGAIPNVLPGFQDLTDPAVRGPFERAWSVALPPEPGLHLTAMFEAMGQRRLGALYVIGENPAQSEADSAHAAERLEALDHLIVQDIVLTRTAQLADVVLPATAAWCEAEGTVTNSERRVQRVRVAVRPPEGARDDIDILRDLAGRLGRPLFEEAAEAAADPAPAGAAHLAAQAERVWDELRALSPIHAGMTYERLERLGGIQWPCFDEHRLEPSFLHGRLWAEDPAERGRPAPFSVVLDEGPVEALDATFPLRLTTGRRLDSYNTGVQSGAYASPLRHGETIDIGPADARALGLHAGEVVRVVSRRGGIEAPVRIDPGLRAGLVFMTPHFPDDVDTNTLTIEATDPRSGTAEFKAAAVRIEKLAHAAVG
jgi:formate dehydrogenase major subunit